MKKEFHIESLGKVVLTHSKRATKLSLRLKPFAPIALTVPLSISAEEAIDFLLRQKDWVLKAQAKMKKVEDEKTVHDRFTENVIPGYDLIFKKNNTSKIFYQVQKGTIVISHPVSQNLRDDLVQENITNLIESVLRYEAKRHLPARTLELAQACGFKYNRVSIRNSKTRWGSCSGTNNINLSLHLMRLPTHLADYIILHELCHTIHKNHGPNFWALLNKVSNLKSNLYKHQLKEYSLKYF